jgi:hypothetical protein
MCVHLLNLIAETREYRIDYRSLQPTGSTLYGHQQTATGSCDFGQVSVVLPARTTQSKLLCKGHLTESGRN